MPASLVDQLGKEPTRPLVIIDCVNLIDTQVKQKGFMVKTAYKAIKLIKGKFVPEVVDSLLDDWLGKLQPHYEKWLGNKSTATFSDYVIARSDEVAEDLLAVTDERAKKTSHTTAKNWYLKMRDSAKQNVVEAIPELSRTLEKHMKNQRQGA